MAYSRERTSDEVNLTSHSQPAGPFTYGKKFNLPALENKTEIKALSDKLTFINLE